jgi:pimeloyl-ACP methyl ester carboxylesterase
MVAPSRGRAKRAAAKLESMRGYAVPETRLEEALAEGKDTKLLEAYFGEETYRELCELARRARERKARGGPRVLILPGIMGSTIGKERLLLDDVFWFNPARIAIGSLVDLALNGAAPKHTSLGVMPLFYELLKLRLQLAGFDADFHHYDWRLSIDKLGALLVDRIKKDHAGEVSLVAHSMGGLVSRAAIFQGTPKLKRLVMLGTPNFGSFAPVQAIRAVYSTVKQVAAIDLVHSAEELATKMFSTFPGLCQMLPTPEKFNKINLFKAAEWPKSEPRPRQKVLDGVQPVQKKLATADDRFFMIAGVNQETVVGLRMEQGDFVYETSLDGDGTVPLDFALLPGAKTYFVEESHGKLQNNAVVGRAVVDILNNGATTALPDRRPASRGAAVRSVRAAELAAVPFGGRKADDLSPSEIRGALEPLLSPITREQVKSESLRASELADAGYAHPFDHVVVGRRRQRRIDIKLALGSITEVDSRAYVLGIFRDVAPGGPALALDVRLDGAITDFTARRMFSGNVGEIFVLPTGRHPVRADVILFAGLGSFDHFDGNVLQLTAENVIRTCIRTQVEELATVLLGAGSGQEIGQALSDLITGFVRGLLDADDDQSFRRLVVCEMNPERYDRIKQELYRLSSTSLFQDVEVTFTEVKLPPPPEAPAAVRGVARGPDPVYLIVRQEGMSGNQLEFRSSILGAGTKATVITEQKSVSASELNKHLERIESESFTFAALDAFGEQLAKLVLPDAVAAVIPEMKGRPLIVVHDAPSSRIPWETIRIAGRSPAADSGLSRRYLAENLSVAKWLERRQHGNVLDLLLVVNPTGDLDGAEEEGKRVRDLFEKHPAVKITELNGPEAKKATLLERFRSGEYDVVHYAGHAFFDRQRPARSGILCNGREVLSGADLAGIGNLPSLVFFNACEAGRIRSAAQRKRRDLDIDKRLQRSVGIAEAFLRGGVANYIGTYWPVGDEPAKTFGATFYNALLSGQTIGQALLDGRTKVRQLSSVDWADYIHYGSIDFALKQR